jgi:hypothetical protein
LIDAVYVSAISFEIRVERPHMVQVMAYVVSSGMTGMKNKAKYLRILVRA